MYLKRLKELRVDHDMTQKDLSTILKTSQQNISYYEKGDRDIPAETLKQLCLLYHVSADYILELPRDLPWGR